MTQRRGASVETARGKVSLLIDGDPEANETLVLAPGAGADMTHEFMQHFAEGLAGEDVRVVRFNFLYSERGRRSPDPQPVLEETYRAVVEEVAGGGRSNRLFLGGKSMGGRIASHLMAEGFPAEGLVCLGYPLHPPGKPERERSAHLPAIEAPILFVEGTRDPFCPLDTLEKLRARVPRIEVAVIQDGNHSLEVPKSSGRSTRDAWNEAIAAIRKWLAALR